MSDQQTNKPFSEYDVFLAHLNEPEDKAITHQVLKSEQGCQQLGAWQEDMKSIENTLDQEVDQDYGAEVWNAIVDKLDNHPKPNRWRHWLSAWQQPRFSALGLALVCVIAVNFYLLGRNHGQPVDQLTNAAAYQQILAQNMRLHLAQTDAFLTQFSNVQNTNELPMLMETAQGLLLSNRLYKNAVANDKDRQLPTLFNELEKVLIEISNGHSPLKQQYLQNYTQQQLLFKVKSIRQQLASKSTPTLST